MERAAAGTSPMEEDSSDAAIKKLAEEAVLAIRMANSPGVTGEQLSTANAMFGNLCGHRAAHRIAMQLVEASPQPEVQHFGLKVLLHAVTAQPSTLSRSDREQLKEWVVSTLSEQLKDGSGLLLAPSYVRAKYAEIVAEIARQDWPAQWPQLVPALLVRHCTPGPASFLLSVWKHLAEILAEDGPGFAEARRQEITAAFADLVQQPSHAPLLITFLQQIVRQHCSSVLLLREALEVCRALAHAVPTEVLLKHQLDDLLQIGFEDTQLQTSAALAASAWVEKLGPFKRQHPSRDNCRFISRLAKLGVRCKFEHNHETYGFHCQVMQLLIDVCTCDVSSLCPVLPEAELSQMWSALLQFLRYPSLSVQLDALTAMLHLLRAHRGSAQAFLAELLSTIYVVLIRLDSLFIGALTSERSQWLMQCLGSASTSAPLSSFDAWCQTLAVTNAFHLRDGETGATDRSQLFGAAKMKAGELLVELCLVGRGEISLEACGRLFQQAASLAQRALSLFSNQDRAWLATFDAALTLVEHPGAMLLQRCQGREQRCRSSLVRTAVAFLKQVFAPAGELSGAIEHRQIELLSHWAPMYRYFDANDLKELLRFLLASVEKTLRPEVKGTASSTELERAAIDAIANLGKCGAVQADQLEAFHSECVRLAPRLSTPGRGKLCEALVATVAACQALGSEHQCKLVNSIMETVSTSWLNLQLTKDDSRASLPRFFARAALASSTGAFEEPHMSALRDARMLLQTFSGVIAKAASAMRSAAANATPKPRKRGATKRRAASEAPTADSEMAAALAAAPHAKLMSGVMRGWAPGIFKLAQIVMGLSVEAAADVVAMDASEREVFTALLRLPSKAEHAAMAGSRTEAIPEECLPLNLERRRVEAVRNMLWELRVSLAKAMKWCATFPDFWLIPEAAKWVATLAESLSSFRPHVAELVLRDVFAPLFGYAGSCSGGGLVTIPGASRACICNVVLPKLVCGSGLLARGSSSTAVPAELEVAWAAAVASASRAAGHLLATLAGSGSPQAGLIAHPARNADGSRLFRNADPAQATHCQENPKKKRRKGQDCEKDMIHSEEEIYVEPPPGAAAYVMGNTELRTSLREALIKLLEVPDKELALTALPGLAVWSTQTWNCLARGEGQFKMENASERSDLLHLANKELLELSEGVLKPVLKFTMMPPSSVSEISVGLLHTSSVAVRQDWADFTNAGSKASEPKPSALVCEASHVLFTVLSIQAWLFQATCRKANMKTVYAQVCLCPPLFEALRICRQELSMTQDDTKALLEIFTKAGMSQDAKRNALRERLHEASARVRR